ncbi:hypothetical protein [Pseudoalteromonas sp. MMG005]|nr:hypothetical protein [Pseudoalteromonas sp. MMG005]MBQ4844392.1 hypothetical protein [Pseudoalteromonas sp. MMG005]
MKVLNKLEFLKVVGGIGGSGGGVVPPKAASYPMVTAKFKGVEKDLS